MLTNSFDHIHELNLGGKSVTVVDEGAVLHALRPVPAVELDRAASHPETPGVGVHRALALYLVACQVGVV